MKVNVSVLGQNGLSDKQQCTIRRKVEEAESSFHEIISYLREQARHRLQCRQHMYMHALMYPHHILVIW